MRVQNRLVCFFFLLVYKINFITIFHKYNVSCYNDLPEMYYFRYYLSFIVFDSLRIQFKPPETMTKRILLNVNVTFFFFLYFFYTIWEFYVTYIIL